MSEIEANDKTDCNTMTWKCSCCDKENQETIDLSAGIASDLRCVHCGGGGVLIEEPGVSRGAGVNVAPMPEAFIGIEDVKLASPANEHLCEFLKTLVDAGVVHRMVKRFVIDIDRNCAVRIWYDCHGDERMITGDLAKAILASPVSTVDE